MYVLVVTSSGSLAESSRDCFHFLLLSRTLCPSKQHDFMKCGCTLLYNEIPPSLVFGNRIICVHNQIVVVVVAVVFVVVVSSFIHWELALCVRLACWLLPAMRSEVF